MAERTGPKEVPDVGAKGFPGWLAVALILLAVGAFVVVLWRFYP